MNRKQWYKQRRLYRLKQLVYDSHGEEGDPDLYNELRKFPEIIRNSCRRGSDTHGYNITEGFSKIDYVRKHYKPELVQKFKGTLRSMMKDNAHMARITSCNCTPFDWFRGN